MAVEAAVIGTGWCGGIRAETLSRSALVSKLHICEIRPDRLAEVQKLTNAATATADYQDIIKNPNICGGLHLHHAGAHAFSHRPRLPAGRQARAAGEADRAGAVGGRHADHARQAQQPQIHHRLFAALQHQDRLRQEEDHRRHARQAGERDGEPASVAQPGQEDRLAREAVAGGHGIHPRSRHRVLAAGAGQARSASTPRAPTATCNP